ncbi:MAG TPA: carboxylesterase [Thiolapillus brandeum]|uniref:Carboxylesterase n=1 Tax=Thiolapillus brandeum TaxID=1076588 RepID=A0A831JR81_9GAMM|nr:carboxylesterase [Thiolapillus brandeum]
MEYPPCLEINPEGSAEYSIIWLHGLGADGNDFVPVIPELRLPADKQVRFVFPNAPVMPVSINNGYVMPAWYDIYAMDLQAKIDVEGIVCSADYLLTLVDAEITAGIQPEHIILAGFSQGGLIALAAALRTSLPLAGVMALSTYLPESIPLSSDLPREIFQAHGRMDAVVSHAVGVNTCSRLKALGHDVRWREYDMAHSVCAEEIADIRGWLLPRL